MTLISVVHRSLERIDNYFSNPLRIQLFGTPLLLRVNAETLTGQCYCSTVLVVVSAFVFVFVFVFGQRRVARKAATAWVCYSAPHPSPLSSHRFRHPRPPPFLTSSTPGFELHQRIFKRVSRVIGVRPSAESLATAGPTHDPRYVQNHLTRSWRSVNPCRPPPRPPRLSSFVFPSPPSPLTHRRPIVPSPLSLQGSAAATDRREHRAAAPLPL